MSKLQIHGPAVRTIREKVKGIPHGKFAVQCGFSPAYLTNIEAGRKQPRPELMHTIAKELGVDIWEITYTIPEQASRAA
jgi:transcriptional regulator with XRE-family HTH domain